MDKVIKPHKTFGGVHAPHKKFTAKMQSVFMPIPKNVIIPMSQHIGAPCTPTVKKGDHVYVGQVVGDSTAFVSAPVHASVSGKVTDVKEMMLTAGNMVMCVFIESDELMELDPSIKAPEKINSRQDLAKIARESGLVGLGGAGFPAHVKLNVPEDKKIEYLIINCAECEPYLTSDHREAIENAQNVIDGIVKIKKILSIDEVIIGIESNKPDAIEHFANLLKGIDGVSVMKLRAMYPQGAEKTLIQAATGRCVPAGKLPSDVGCIVMNIGSVSFLSSYMENGIPLIKKRLTLDGSAIENPMNVIVPVGTIIKDIVDFSGGYISEPKKIIMGGPMMGMAVVSDEVPVLKQNNGILCFDEIDSKGMETTDCIRCGRCVAACPMHLIPTKLEKYSERGDVEELLKANIMTCMECGCCAFSCPASRKLVQAIRLGKNYVRKAGSK